MLVVKKLLTCSHSCTVVFVVPSTMIVNAPDVRMQAHSWWTTAWTSSSSNSFWSPSWVAILAHGWSFTTRVLHRGTSGRPVVHIWPFLMDGWNCWHVDDVQCYVMKYSSPATSTLDNSRAYLYNWYLEAWRIECNTRTCVMLNTESSRSSLATSNLDNGSFHHL